MLYPLVNIVGLNHQPETVTLLVWTRAYDALLWFPESRPF